MKVKMIVLAVSLTLCASGAFAFSYSSVDGGLGDLAPSRTSTVSSNNFGNDGINDSITQLPACATKIQSSISGQDNHRDSTIVSVDFNTDVITKTCKNRIDGEYFRCEQ